MVPPGGADIDLAIRRQAALVHVAGETAGTITALLDLTAVGIEDPVVKFGIGGSR